MPGAAEGCLRRGFRPSTISGPSVLCGVNAGIGDDGFDALVEKLRSVSRRGAGGAWRARRSLLPTTHRWVLQGPHIASSDLVAVHPQPVARRLSPTCGHRSSTEPLLRDHDSQAAPEGDL